MAGHLVSRIMGRIQPEGGGEEAAEDYEDIGQGT